MKTTTNLENQKSYLDKAFNLEKTKKISNRKVLISTFISMLPIYYIVKFIENALTLALGIDDKNLGIIYVQLMIITVCILHAEIYLRKNFEQSKDSLTSSYIRTLHRNNKLEVALRKALRWLVGQQKADKICIFSHLEDHSLMILLLNLNFQIVFVMIISNDTLNLSILQSLFYLLCFNFLILFEDLEFTINSLLEDRLIQYILVAFFMLSVILKQTTAFFPAIALIRFISNSDKQYEDCLIEIQKFISFNKKCMSTLESMSMGIYFHSSNEAKRFMNSSAFDIIKPKNICDLSWMNRFILDKEATPFPLNTSKRQIKDADVVLRSHKKYDLKDMIRLEESQYIKDTSPKSRNEILFLGIFSCKGEFLKRFEIYKTPYARGNLCLMRNARSKSDRIRSSVKDEVVDNNRILKTVSFNETIAEDEETSNLLENEINLEASQKEIKDGYKSGNLRILKNIKSNKRLENKISIIEEEILPDSEELEESELMEKLYFQSDCVFIIKDISKQYETHRKIVETKYKNLINGKMSHEIKTTCIALSYYILDIEQFVLLNLKKSKYMPMFSNITKIKSLTDQILNVNMQMCDYSRAIDLCEAQFEEININEQIDWGYWYLLSIIGQDPTKKIDVEVQYNDTSVTNKYHKIMDSSTQIPLIDENTVVAVSDPLKFKAILSEILKNCLKYTSKGKISILVKQISEELEVQIVDTGRGISGNRLAEIRAELGNLEKKYFDYTVITKNLLPLDSLRSIKLSDVTSNVTNFADQGGLNLGLQMIKFYCLKLDINMRIESTSGKGTSVFLRLQNNIPPHKTIELSIRKPQRTHCKSTLMLPKFNYSQVFSPMTHNSANSNNNRKKKKTNPLSIKFNTILDLNKEFYKSKEEIKMKNSIDDLAIIQEADVAEFSQEESPDLRMLIVNKKLKSTNLNYSPKSQHEECKSPVCDNFELNSSLKIKRFENELRSSNTKQKISTLNLKSKLSTGSISSNLHKNKINKEDSFDSSDKNLEYILVVDDDYLCRNNIKKLLHSILKELKMNFGIVKCADGLDTLNIVIGDQSKNGGKLRLIISDENMNYLNGSDSFYILNRLFTMNKLSRIPMVILTALEDSEALNKIKKSSNVSEILKKPANKITLRSLIIKLLGSN